MTMTLLNDGNSKTAKGEKLGYITHGIYLASGPESGHNVCQWASKGCLAACLDYAGRGTFRNVRESRVKKTQWLFREPEAFRAKLRKEICLAIKRDARKEMKSVFRLNLTSDLDWLDIVKEYPEQVFYDYTKSMDRASAYLAGDLPANYYLVYSMSEQERSKRFALSYLASGGSVAIVFRGHLPETWHGYRVVDGDDTDLRFLDPENCIVGLVEKGLAKKDSSGFVQEPISQEIAV